MSYGYLRFLSVNAYDLEGNLTSITDATGRTEQITYDVAGRLLSYTSNGGNSISYDYDKLNNLVEKSYTDANGNTSGESVVYAYNALGERVEMYDSTGDTVYTYDSLGRITSVTTYRTPGTDGSEGTTGGSEASDNGFSHAESQGDTITYTYNEADNLSAITYPDGTSVYYEYDLNDNIIKVTDREGLETTYVYDAINRITEIHRPNGISTYNTYNARNQITELTNICDDCEWVVSTYSYTYDDKGFIITETAIESLAGYAYDEKYDGKHEDGKHDDLYPHGNNHNGKHDKDATFAYQIVQVDRTFTYDDAGKLLSSTETEDNYGTYTYTYEYDLMGNRTAVVKTDESGDVAESRYYTYNESSQLIEVELYNGKKTTTVTYEYDADGNLISETGKDGTDKVELTYTYTVENRLEEVYDGKELLMAAAYDGDGNRVFQLNYNLHTDDDWKGNNGNGNGSNKDNSGSSKATKNNKGKNGNSTGNGNATNAEENNSQNQCGILFPIAGEVSNTEDYLISRIKTEGKEKNYELIEYINDVNREYAEVLVEQNINGADDTTYVYGAVIGNGADRLSLDRFHGSTGYYIYDSRGSVTGITNEEGQVYQSYRYSAFGEITFGAPEYENEYTYNGESYNPNIESQYLRARYYDVVIATFITEDFYPQDMWSLWNITEPLTLNRYNYCVSSPLNYVDPSGYLVEDDIVRSVMEDSTIAWYDKGNAINERIDFYHTLQYISDLNATFGFVIDYDYAGDRDYLNETYAKATEQRWNIEMGMAMAEENSETGLCYAIAGTDENRLTQEQQRENAQYIYDYLIREGWTVEAICGLLGNIDEESRFNPGGWQINNSPGAGYGLVQWTAARDKFFKWMEEEKGYDMLRQKEGESKEYLLAIDVVNDLATNNPQLLLELELEYLIFSSEASTPTEQREWYATTAYSSPYKMSYAEYIKSDLEVRDLALVFHASYERLSDGDDEWEERAIAAEKWYLIFTEDEMN